MASVTAASLVLFFASCACGVLLSALVDRRHSGDVVAIAGTLSSLFMMLASAAVLVTGRNFEASLWVLQGLGPFTLRLDTLSSVFLFAAGIVYFSVSLFVRDFIGDQFGATHPAHRYGVMYFGLMASVGLVLTANDAPLFLISWECMSILCFLLINYEPRQQADRSAGYIMLAMSEAGFLAVVIAFLILGRAATNFSFRAGHRINRALPPRPVECVSFRISRLRGKGWVGSRELLAPPILYGRALSLHSGFCRCHAQSGLLRHLRLNGDLVHCGYGTGVFALIVGSLTALVGILYATTERDMKTMLAYSSIENAGIIVAGLGAFLIYRASGHPVASAIALTAALYHMFNHSIYKTLLFQGTAYVEAETGTRDMDQLAAYLASYQACGHFPCGLSGHLRSSPV